MVVVVSLNHVDRGWPNKSANLCPDPSQPQPFPSNSPKVFQRFVMSDARLRRVNKEIAGALHFFSRSFVLGPPSDLANSPKTARMTSPLTLTSISSTIHPFISVVLSTAQKTPLTQAVTLKSCVSQFVLSPPPTNIHRLAHNDDHRTSSSQIRIPSNPSR